MKKYQIVELELIEISDVITTSPNDDSTGEPDWNILD